MKRIIILILLVITILLVGCSPPPLITHDQAQNYIDKTVQIELTPTREISSDIKFEFFIVMPIVCSTGKTTIIRFIFIPLFERYTVYETKELLFLGIEKKGNKLELNKSVLIKGKIVQDKDNKVLAILSD